MHSLKVGLFTYGMENELTGIGRYAQELAYGLKRLALPVELILISPYERSLLDWYKELPVQHIPSLKRLPSVLTRGPLALSKTARQLQLDILHDPCGIAPFRRCQVPYAQVVTIHDAIPLVHPEFQPLATKLVYRTFLRWAKDTSDAVITVSNHAKSDIANTLHVSQEHIFVTPLGTQCPTDWSIAQKKRQVPAALLRLDMRRPYFLWVGADSPRKNLSRVLQAFEGLHHEMPNVELVLVGPRKNVVRLPSGVRHLGFIDQSLLDTLYLGALGLIYPSLYEGFGMPILEAMSFGTPVVTSNLSSMPEVAGTSALLVDPYSPLQIRNAMTSLLDPLLRDDLFTKGRHRAQQYQWDTTVLNTYQVYKHTMDNRPLSRPKTLRISLSNKDAIPNQTKAPL